jgi:hypothetical protein
MSESAHITSLEALRDFRAAFLIFCEEVKDALTATDQEGKKLLDRIQRDYQSQWQRAIRDREEEVSQAKSALFRKQIVKNVDGRTPDCLEEKKAVRKAEARLEEAKEKLKNCKQWGGHLLPRALDEFAGPSRQLAALVEGEPPHAALLLDKVLDSLDAYLHLDPGISMGPPITAGSSTSSPPAPSSAPAPPPVESKVKNQPTDPNVIK